MNRNAPQSPAPQENKMGTMPIAPLLAGMAVPMMISMLVQALYNIVDSVFVARLSQDALNAVSLAFPLQNLMIAVGGGTGVGMNALLSRSLGEKKQDVADKAANTGIFLTLCSGVVFGVCGLLFSRAFFLAQTDIAPIVDYGTSYATICLGLSIGIFSQFCFERLLQSTGRTLYSMITQLIGAVINIILDPILIFGYFGLPRMGVAGAAVATVVGQIVAGIVSILYNLKKNDDITISFQGFRPDGYVIAGIYKVGLPSIVMQSIGSVMTYGMNLILVGLSSTAAAVFGVYFKLQSFFFMPVFGLNNGIIPIVAYNYGAKKKKRMIRTIKWGMCIACCFMVLGFLAFETVPGMLLLLFDASENMLSIGVPALRTIAISFLSAWFCIVASSVFQAVGNGMYSLYVSVARQLVVLLPVAYILAKIGGLSLIWWCFPIAELMSGVISAICLMLTFKKVIQPLPEEV